MSSRKPSTPRPATGSPQEPALFGNYYLLGLIARGGMAEVYRARRVRSKNPRMLALKMMRPNLAREARFVDMFGREGRLAMLLRNRSIVETVDVGVVDGHHYIAMEYIGGRDLNQVVRRVQETKDRIPVPHAVFIASRIAEGLEFAHRLSAEDGRLLNLVNRDVSPSNARVSFDGEVKILDFGIAQAMLQFTSEIGTLKGKFSYMSPEQIRGLPLDARTDIFSAGIVLYEMLTLEKLFRGDSEFALMEAVRKAEVSPPSKFNRRVPPELDEVVLKTLSRDPAQRYQHAADFQKDLEEILVRYDFRQSELRQFMRKLFRREVNVEERVIDMALSVKPRAQIVPDEELDDDQTIDMVSPPAGMTLSPSSDKTMELEQFDSLGGDSAQSADTTGRSEIADSDKPRGFWSRLKRKRRPS